MLTIEIIGVLVLLVGLLIYAMVRTQLQRREVSVLWEAGRPARILIVDDDPDFVKITKKVLDSHGYEIYTASSGAEALKVMRAAPVKLDLVLLDIMMDYITDGLDVSNAMQRDPTLKDIPVIMITSLTGVKSQEKASSAEGLVDHGRGNIGWCACGRPGWGPSSFLGCQRGWRLATVGTRRDVETVVVAVKVRQHSTRPDRHYPVKPSLAPLSSPTSPYCLTGGMEYNILEKCRQ